MRVRTAIAFAASVLLLGTGTALAFQEEPGAPPPDAARMLPETADPALALQTPHANPAETAEKKSSKLFNFGILPKLDFGLELLYSQQPMQLHDSGGPTIEEQSDVTVLGKVKRHF